MQSADRFRSRSRAVGHHRSKSQGGRQAGDQNLRDTHCSVPPSVDTPDRFGAIVVSVVLATQDSKYAIETASDLRNFLLSYHSFLLDYHSPVSFREEPALETFLLNLA
jgi:hypothetical protein